MVEYGDKKVVVELECRRELLSKLPNNIDELDKDWRALLIAVLFIAMATALLKFMPKRKPFLLNQYLETTQRSVEWIQEQHRKRSELRCSIPAIRAVNQYREATAINEINYTNSSSHNQPDVIKPVSVLQVGKP